MNDKKQAIWIATYAAAFTSMALRPLQGGLGYPDELDRARISEEACTVADDAVRALSPKRIHGPCIL